MFGKLKFEGDHVDLSYRDPSGWRGRTTGGAAAEAGMGEMPPDSPLVALQFDLGDADQGPSIEMGCINPVDGFELDWEHLIDPLHYHGTDQFRICLDGEWVAARHPYGKGEFAFQESGRVYQERPGPDHTARVLVVYGDRRGVRSTLTLEEDRNGPAGHMLAPFLATDPYPHPAGPKGAVGIGTNIGTCAQGYLWASVADSASWPASLGGNPAMVGVFGDDVGGPVVYGIHAAPNQLVTPRCTLDAAMMLVVVNGSCRVGATEYLAAETRVQQSGTTLDEVVSGADGADVFLIVVDRRAMASAKVGPDEVSAQWKEDAERLCADLVDDLVVRPG